MNKTEPAFPTTSWDDYNKKSVPNVLTGGLTKREYFAAMALQGIMARMSPYDSSAYQKDYAKQCVEIADELLKQLSK